ncbi:NAD-dependent epimerase/dehydratase family protein [Kutzneria sp. NPDC052558]|uniref:NAD-dependent epimerase/dehydratase family protein n=1 Tax=Kutzneria sp. NPDC052558 TaxID=3364121 RepID=UPI0037C6606C
MRQRSVLVTGGQGYLGSVVGAALTGGGSRVTVVDNGRFSDVRTEQSGVDYLSADVRDVSDWQRVLSGVDAVVHLAAVVGDPACSVDENLAWETNYLGTIRVAEACRRAGVGRLVFASTCSTYGVADEEEVDIWSPLNPQSVYARSKVLAEHYLLSPHQDGPRPCILRFATLHGLSPRMRFDLAVNVMTADAVRDGLVTVHGGTQWRPFLHVRDAATAITRALATLATGIYNCGSDAENLRMSEVARVIAQQVPGTRVEHHPQQTDPRSYRVSFGRIGAELSFRPKRTVADSVREIRDAMAAGEFTDHRAPRYSNYLTAVTAAAQ